MTRVRLSSLFAGLSLAAVASAGAQTDVSVVITAPWAPINQMAVTAFGYYMSPYTGTVDGVQNIRLNCVDFFHDVNLNDPWTAVKINLGAAILNPNLLLTTRDGMLTGANLANVLKIYEEAAWLTAQTPPNPGKNATTSTETVAIQTAIWAIVDSLNPTVNYKTAVPGDVVGSFTVNTGPLSTAYWIQQAQNVVNNHLVSNSYFGAFNVITDEFALNDGTRFPADLTKQEFIYMSPEPGTWALMATGLMMVGGFAARNRRRKAGQMVSAEELAS